MEVEVIRSARRRKTIEARLVGDTLEVRVPARLSRQDEEQCVADMVARFSRRRDTKAIDLEARATSLARRYDLPVPAGVRWVENQHRRWGSCTIATGQIRVSAVLATYPTWVLDYVLVHEMAHLVEANHSPAFHALVARYPKAERAEGFLIAKGLGDADDGSGADDVIESAAEDPPVPPMPPDDAPVPAAPVDAVAGTGEAVQPSLF
jgi:predicted metal-dependent hydrolase